MDFDGAGAEDVADDVPHLVVDDGEPVGEARDDLFEGHHAGVGRRPLQADHVWDLGEPLYEGTRDTEAGPERVVHDQPDIGCLGGGQHVLVEIILGVLEVERRRDLHEVGADPFCGVHDPDELGGAGRLAAHRDRHSSGGRLYDRFRHRGSLIEGHRREVPRSAPGQENRAPGLEPPVDQESDMAADGVEVDRQIRVFEHRRDRDVAADEPAAAGFTIHGVPPWLHHHRRRGRVVGLTDILPSQG